MFNPEDFSIYTKNILAASVFSTAQFSLFFVLGKGSDISLQVLIQNKGLCSECSQTKNYGNDFDFYIKHASIIPNTDVRARQMGFESDGYAEHTYTPPTHPTACKPDELIARLQDYK